MRHRRRSDHRLHYRIATPSCLFGLVFLSNFSVHGITMADQFSRTLQRIPKLEAAKRQLNQAIALWFHDDDEVSIHTLVHAAHQIVFDIHAKKGTDIELLYNTDAVKPEFHKEWQRHIKKPGNFFKHADDDREGEIEFTPYASVGFILYAARGLHALGERESDHIDALAMWCAWHDPKLVTEDFRKFVCDSMPVEEAVRHTSERKAEFFEAFLTGRRQARQKAR
jgi:hypothetical protein